MNQPSGFVPIGFKTAGWILLALGALGLGVWTAFRIAGSTGAGTFAPIFCSILIAIGTYLLYVSRREADRPVRRD